MDNKAKKYELLLFILFMGSIFSANSQTVKNYQAKEFKAKDGVLSYRVFRPKQDIMHIKRLPLIIFLHGAGERGNDNKKQLIHVAEIFTNPENQKRFPAYVIAPQCAENHKWTEVDWNLLEHDMPDTISDYAGMTMELTDWLLSTLPIDTNRIYVTGLSMGGFGTWDLISRYPNKFAAAAPVCGGGDIKQAHKLVNIPIWAFHGAKDRVVTVNRTRDMIEAIKNSGGTPKYTEYPNLGHFCWDAAYNEQDFLEWLFSQCKK